MEAPSGSVLILGAGAIGQWLAALISSCEVPSQVTLLCRERQKQQLLESGLRIKRHRGIEVYWPEVVTDLGALQGRNFDSVIMTVKAFQVEPLLQQVLDADLQFNSFCTLQNGWGSDELSVRAFPERQVWVTTTTVAVGVDDDGVILPTLGVGGMGAGLASLGSAYPTFGFTPMEKVAPPSWISHMGLSLHVAEDWRCLKWSKMLLNMVCNATCALLDWLPGQVVEVPQLFDIELHASREALEVARRLDIKLVDLPGYPVRRFALASQLHPWLCRRVLAPRIRSGRGDKAPSFLLDMRADRGRTEVQYLNGAVAREAHKLGLKAPYNEKLAQLLDEVSLNRQRWEEFRNNPKNLVRQFSSMT